MSSIPPNNRRTRPGFVLVTVIVVIVLALTLFGVWAKSAISQRRGLDGIAARMQAERLAESGVARAIERLAAAPDYTGETWSIPADELQRRDSAEVRIQVRTSGDEVRISATADFPAGDARRARVTKQVDVLRSNSRDAS